MHLSDRTSMVRAKRNQPLLYALLFVVGNQYEDERNEQAQDVVAAEHLFAPQCLFDRLLHDLDEPCMPYNALVLDDLGLTLLCVRIFDLRSKGC